MITFVTFLNVEIKETKIKDFLSRGDSKLLYAG
jgi:hypothetical protein